MRQKPDVVRREALLALRNGVARGVFCSALLVLLWLIGIPLVLTLIPPVAVYASLRLVGTDHVEAGPIRSRVTRETRDAFESCLSFQNHLLEMSGDITDTALSETVEVILIKIEQILNLIADEAMYKSGFNLRGRSGPQTISFRTI